VKLDMRWEILDMRNVLFGISVLKSDKEILDVRYEKCFIWN
jgi:hypothetical protein